MTWEADRDKTRCTQHMGELRCALEYDHEHGHVYVSGSYVADRHTGN